MLLPAIRTWSEWGAMFTDVARWTPAVRAICRQAGLPVRDIAAGYPGTNAVFVLDQTYVLKIYAPFCRHDFEIERELYPLLIDVGLPVPEVVAQGVLLDRIRWPYIVMTFLPGAPIREVRSEIAQAELLHLAGNLGRMLRTLHRIPLARVQSLDTSEAAWLQFIKQQKTKVVDRNRHEGVLPVRVLKEMPRFLSVTLADMSSTSLVLLNGDVTEDHLLLNQVDARWQISGLIDLADSLVGWPDYEWVALWFGALGRNRAALQATLAAYDPAMALDAAFYRRAFAFTLLHEFGAQIIAEVLTQLGRPNVRSLQHLQALLWGV